MNMPFWNRISVKSIKSLAVLLDRKIYYSSEVVIVNSEIPNCMLMLKEGHVESIVRRPDGEEIVVDEHIQKEFMKTKTFQWILLEESLQQYPSRVTIKSSGYSVIMQLSVESAIAALRDNQEDYERYCYFRDERLLRQC
jgi:hypothetical protein